MKKVNIGQKFSIIGHAVWVVFCLSALWVIAQSQKGVGTGIERLNQYDELPASPDEETADLPPAFVVSEDAGADSSLPILPERFVQPSPSKSDEKN